MYCNHNNKKYDGVNWWWCKIILKDHNDKIKVDRNIEGTLYQLIKKYTPSSYHPILHCHQRHTTTKTHPSLHPLTNTFFPYQLTCHWHVIPKRKSFKIRKIFKIKKSRKGNISTSSCVWMRWTACIKRPFFHVLQSTIDHYHF